jgi:hypothetical protein
MQLIKSPSTLLCSLMVAASPVLADTASEMADLKKRLATLEAKQEAIRPADAATDWSDRIKVSGIVEVEGSYTNSDAFTGDSQSDIVVATAELDFEARVAENVTANINMLYEDDGEDVDVDVATITFADVAGMDIVLGRTIVPFGVFETNLVNDTLVQELAETHESVAMLTAGSGLFSASTYVFNGDADNGDTIENYGVSLSVGNEQFAAGLDYISNAADTDGIYDVLAPAVDINDTPDAFIAHAKATFGPVNLIGEFFQADEFDTADWGFGFEPKAWQLEAAFTVSDWTIAAAYQETGDMGGFVPEKRTSIGVSTDVVENVLLGVELWRDKDYGTAESGSGENANSAVVQVAVIF